MLRLDLKRDPHWLDLGHGVRILVEPLSTSTMMRAREALSERIDLPEDEDALDANDQQRLAIAMAQEVARLTIVDWEGVGDAQGRPAKVSPEGIDALMDVWQIFEAFQTRYLQPAILLDQEKNGSALSASGTSRGVKNTAPRARSAATSARTKSTSRKPAKGRRSGA